MAIEKRTINGKEIDWDTDLDGPVMQVPTQQLHETTGMTREEKQEFDAVHAENEKTTQDEAKAQEQEAIKTVKADAKALVPKTSGSKSTPPKTVTGGGG